jgi:hypothetical protein
MKPVGNLVVAAVFSVSLAGLAYAAGNVPPGAGGARGEVGPADSGGGIAPGTIPGTNTPGPDIGRTPAMGTETPGSLPQPGTIRPGESSLGIERQPLPPGSSVPPDSGLPPPPSSPTPGSGGSGSMGGSPTK